MLPLGAGVSSWATVATAAASHALSHALRASPALLARLGGGTGGQAFGARGLAQAARAPAVMEEVRMADAAAELAAQQAPPRPQAQAAATQEKRQPAPAPLAPAVPASGVKKTFYKRKLPCPPATEFSSADGRLLFSEALQQGTMNGFFKLVEQYSTQDEPAFCGLASIAMVLNALSIDPRRPWKGSWRWFHEALLDCCLPLSDVAREGVNLSQAGCLAKCNGANVTLHRHGTFSLPEFRAAVVDVCSSGEEHLIVSYSRKEFGQTGDGHFSPVGGYHAGRDLVLILDTARFKYPPHWVPLPMLFDAMQRIDASTGQPRGFLRLSANAQPDSVLFTLDIRGDGQWRAAEAFVRSQAPALVRDAAARGDGPEATVAELVARAPLSSVAAFVAVRYAAQMCARDRCVPHTVRQQVLQELRATPLYQVVQPLLARQLQLGGAPAQQQQQGGEQQPRWSQQQLQPGGGGVLQPHACHSQQLLDQQQLEQQQHPHDFLAEKLTMLLLLHEPSSWAPHAAWADEAQRQAWQQLTDASAVSIVEGEAAYLRQQLRHIDDVLRDGGGGGGGGTDCGSCHVQLDCSVRGCARSSAATAAAAEAAAAEAAAAGRCGGCGGTG